VYLIIGNERESCALAVKVALEGRGRTVLVDTDPLGVSARLRWQFDSLTSSIDYRAVGAAGEVEPTLQGVFVRHYAGLQQTGGWNDEDLSYMRSEGMAALLAWLHALDCPVVGRPGDDAWYRPRRPLPEWLSVLAEAGLSTPRVVVTNVVEGDRHEREWSGRATYRPLTSPRSYTISGGAWAEIQKVMEHVPVCLTEPVTGPLGVVTLACGRTFWSEPDVPRRDELDRGVRRVADRLASDFIQLEYGAGAAGPRFVDVNLAPILERHSADDQIAIASRIADELTSGAACRAAVDDLRLAASQVRS
jgi:hypothetical protein